MTHRSSRLLMGAILAVLLAAPAEAQKGGPPRGTPPSQPGGASAQPFPATPSSVPGMQNPPFLYGKILTESGGSLPQSTSIELNCGYQFVKAIHPQVNGGFQFDLRGGPQSDTDMSAAVNPSAGGPGKPMDPRGASVGSGPSSRALTDCELRISAPGYQPLEKTINMQTGDISGVNAGEVVLTPLLMDQGTAVSVTSLLVPKKARKEFDKGENDFRRNKLKPAAAHFEKAVAGYQQYAVAWNELGRIYLLDKKNDDAAQAFGKATAADPQYIPPYVSLAELQLQQSQFEAAAATAGKALVVSPGLASAGFVQALAYFKLNRLDDAEKSARAAETGPHQNLPQLHLLLTDILLRKSDYQGAVVEMQAYLKEFPNGQMAIQVKKQLPEVEARAAIQPAQPPRPASEPARTRNPEGQPKYAPTSLPAAAPPPAGAALNVYLRMPDDAPFTGIARVSVKPSNGAELDASTLGSEGDITFPKLAPGTYSIEANAPGFVPIQTQTTLDTASRVHTMFLIMKPISVPPVVPQPPAPDVSSADAASWIPANIDASVPSVQPGVACSLPRVLRGASRRMSEFVENLQKVDATERLSEIRSIGTGPLGAHTTRTFDYVAIINRVGDGAFEVDEYRNGSLDPSVFPDDIATNGLAVMALILHPSMIPEFNFTCEGLGQWDGHPAWQIHFAQRADRPNLIRAYVIAHNYYPVPLKGRVWIDAATFHVRHLESDLIAPMPQIALTREHMSIDYGPVEFDKHARRLWLPLDAQIYWERQGRRYYRRHTFTNFKLFEVGVAQEIQPPKESYCFMNLGEHDVTGTLTLTPTAGARSRAASTQFSIPVGSRLCKSVGIGKDLNIRADSVASAVFTFDGPSGSIAADATLPNGTMLDLVPDSQVAALKH